MKTSKFDLRNYNIFMYLIGTKYYLVKWFDIFCSMFISDLPKGTFISDFTNPFGLHICASPSCSNLIALKQFISRTKRCFCSLVHVIWVALLGYGTIVCISGPFTNDVRARTCRKGLESLTVIIWPDDEIKIWHEKIVILHVFDWNATLPSKVIDMFFLCGHTHCNLTNPFGVLSYHVTTSLNCSSLRALNNSLADATKASSKALASLVLFHP